MNITVIFLLFILILLMCTISLIQNRQKSNNKCSKHSCSAQDDVNNPDYNVKEVIKNTILIEQHLAEKRKYCKQCIVKHFLISIGLLEEAICMSGKHIAEYKNLEDSETFYTRVFNQWHSNMDCDINRLNTLGKLRDWRREMLELYYF